MMEFIYVFIFQLSFPGFLFGLTVIRENVNTGLKFYTISKSVYGYE